MASKTISDINDIRDRMLNSPDNDTTKIYVHMGTCGIASGASEVLMALKKSLKDNGYKQAKIIQTAVRVYAPENRC